MPCDYEHAVNVCVGWLSNTFSFMSSMSGCLAFSAYICIHRRVPEIKQCTTKARHAQGSHREEGRRG